MNVLRPRLSFEQKVEKCLHDQINICNFARRIEMEYSTMYSELNGTYLITMIVVACCCGVLCCVLNSCMGGGKYQIYAVIDGQNMIYKKLTTPDFRGVSSVFLSPTSHTKK